jgi:hypothetical protein
VTWQNNDFTTAHTATSNVSGFFNTGFIAGDSSGHVTMRRVGTFPYHCQVHPTTMRGKIRIPLRASDTTIALGSSTTLRLESAAGVTGTFSIARRRPGGTWRIIKSGVAGPTTKVKPPAGGTWQYRARAKNANGSSGWSPLVQISASS